MVFFTLTTNHTTTLLNKLKKVAICDQRSIYKITTNKIHFSHQQDEVNVVALLRAFFKCTFIPVQTSDRRKMKQEEETKRSFNKWIEKLITTCTMYFMIGPVDMEKYKLGFTNQNGHSSIYSKQYNVLLKGNAKMEFQIVSAMIIEPTVLVQKRECSIVHLIATHPICQGMDYATKLLRTVIKKKEYNSDYENKRIYCVAKLPDTISTFRTVAKDYFTESQKKRIKNAGS